MAEELDVVERVLQILQDGAYSSTYKLAVLVGLMDLCVENTSAMGWPPTTITTRQLAEKVVELYWLQVRDWNGGQLQQNRGQQGVIVREIADLRSRASGLLGVGASIGRVRMALPTEVEVLVRLVEWKLIEMPLPKLQRVGPEDTGWLYNIAWTDATCPTEGTVRSYQAGEHTDFDNRIQLRPEVAMAFVRLHGLLRPFVEQKWTSEVARINRLDRNKLHDHLFGADRIDVGPVRAPLLELQRGACFYCETDLRKHASAVDHFIPWSRHSDNGLDNLVLAHAACNNDKRDYLAGAAHLERWRRRRQEQANELLAIADSARWDLGADRTLGAACALYLNLPGDARLWTGAKGNFEVAEQRRLQAILA